MKKFVIALTLLALPLLAAAKDSPLSVDGTTTIDTAKARQLFEQDVAFVDTRKNSDWDAGRIPGAIHLDVKKVLSPETLAEEVPRDEPVVFYCNGHNCLRSSKASRLAVSWGWSTVYYYRDGFPAWKAAGNPVE